MSAGRGERTAHWGTLDRSGIWAAARPAAARTKAAFIVMVVVGWWKFGREESRWIWTVDEERGIRG